MMAELISIVVALVSLLALLMAWSHQKREQYHALAALTKEYVSAVQEVYADEKIPDNIKAFFKRISPRIDDRQFAKNLAKTIWRQDKTKTDFFKDLDQEQVHKLVTAIMLFVVALSYANPSHGWKLREFILSNEIRDRAVSAGRAIRSTEMTPGLPQAA